MTAGDRYITVTPAVQPTFKFNVSIRAEQHDGEYVVTRISEPLPHFAAKALAESWAAALHLEIR